MIRLNAFCSTGLRSPSPACASFRHARAFSASASTFSASSFVTCAGALAAHRRRRRLQQRRFHRNSPAHCSSPPAPCREYASSGGISPPRSTAAASGSSAVTVFSNSRCARTDASFGCCDRTPEEKLHAPPILALLQFRFAQSFSTPRCPSGSFATRPDKCPPRAPESPPSETVAPAASGFQRSPRSFGLQRNQFRQQFLLLAFAHSRSISSIRAADTAMPARPRPFAVNGPMIIGLRLRRVSLLDSPAAPRSDWRGRRSARAAEYRSSAVGFRCSAGCRQRRDQRQFIIGVLALQRVRVAQEIDCLAALPSSSRREPSRYERCAACLHSADSTLRERTGPARSTPRRSTTSDDRHPTRPCLLHPRRSARRSRSGLHRLLQNLLQADHAADLADVGPADDGQHVDAAFAHPLQRIS